LQELSGDSLADLPNNRAVRVRKFRVSGCIFGFYLEHYATPLLTSSSFIYSGIHEWLPSPTKVALAEGSATIVSPSRVLTVIDTTVKVARIRLQVAPNVQFGPAGRWHSGRNESRLIIEPAEAQSLQWFTKLAYRFENFFSLCLGTSVRLKTLSLTGEGEKEGFLLRPKRTKAEKPDVGVWIRVDASELTEAICSWFQTPDEFLQLERLIYGTIRHGSLSPEN
jgi:ApeA N-terminal domain 1